MQNSSQDFLAYHLPFQGEFVRDTLCIFALYNALISVPLAHTYSQFRNIIISQGHS